jgi:type IX secretion system PorP/SprF family membrane protein
MLSALMFLLFQVQLNAQQEPQFTHNMFNYSYVNPGHYGLTDGICVTGIIREQWLGFKDENGTRVSPETFLFSADAPFRFLHGGLGISIVQDKYGYFTDMGVKLGYSYHKQMGAGTLGIGVNANFLNKKLDFSKLIPIDEGDPVLAGTSSDGVMITDMSAGVYLKQPRYYMSLSSSQLLESEKSLSNKGAGNGTFKMRRHYYLSGGYDLSFPAFAQYTITPSVFLKSDGSTFQVDLNALVNYNRKVWGGASYRLGDAFAIMGGLVLKDIEVGYSYDVPMSRIGATGSHEVMVRYIFKLEREKVRTGYHNTRFL